MDSTCGLPLLLAHCHLVSVLPAAKHKPVESPVCWAHNPDWKFRQQSSRIQLRSLLLLLNMPRDPAISSEERRLGTRCPLLGIWFFFLAGFVKFAICVIAFSSYQHLLSGQDMGCPNPPPVLQVYPSPLPPGSQYPDQHSSMCIIWSEKDFHIRECMFTQLLLTTPRQQLTRPDFPDSLPEK